MFYSQQMVKWRLRGEWVGIRMVSSSEHSCHQEQVSGSHNMIPNMAGGCAVCKKMICPTIQGIIYFVKLKYVQVQQNTDNLGFNRFFPLLFYEPFSYAFLLFQDPTIVVHKSNMDI